MTSFLNTTAHLHNNSGSGPGWWLPSELLLLPKLTTRGVYLLGAQLSGDL